jgi:hypothetical protein
MVSLGPNFTTLAVFCGLAAMLHSPVSAVAIHGRDAASTKATAGHSPRRQIAVLPLPLMRSAAKENKVSAFLTHLFTLLV